MIATGKTAYCMLFVVLGVVIGIVYLRLLVLAAGVA
jgi:hypothetical protein